MKEYPMIQWRCYKCNGGLESSQYEIICSKCGCMVHNHCHTTLDTINFTKSILKEEHKKCVEQVDIA